MANMTGSYVVATLPCHRLVDADFFASSARWWWDTDAISFIHITRASIRSRPARTRAVPTVSPCHFDWSACLLPFLIISITLNNNLLIVVLEFFWSVQLRMKVLIVSTQCVAESVSLQEFARTMQFAVSLRHGLALAREEGRWMTSALFILSTRWCLVQCVGAGFVKIWHGREQVLLMSTVWFKNKMPLAGRGHQSTKLEEPWRIGDGGFAASEFAIALSQPSKSGCRGSTPTLMCIFCRRNFLVKDESSFSIDACAVTVAEERRGVASIGVWGSSPQSGSYCSHGPYTKLLALGQVSTSIAFCILLPPFYNVNYSSISHIHIFFDILDSLT